MKKEGEKKPAKMRSKNKPKLNIVRKRTKGKGIKLRGSEHSNSSVEMSPKMGNDAGEEQKQAEGEKSCIETDDVLGIKEIPSSAQW